MTYLEFLLIFILPPLVLETLLASRFRNPERVRFLQGIGCLTVLALVYTTPWDNYLVASGVWSYSDERVLGRWGYVPYEEYAFFILQTCLTGLWCFLLHVRSPLRARPLASRPLSLAISFALFAITLFGVSSMFNTNTRYLGLILAWATPVLLLQWLVGGRHLLAHKRFFMAAVIPPTLYLWTADALAIRWEVWKISLTQTVGWNPFGLPLEEAVFFLITNLMVVQGLMLFVLMRPHAKAHA